MRGEMNPRERWGLLLLDETPDRPPVYPLVTSHAATVLGCDLIQFCTDGRVLAEAQLAAQRRYGHEGLSVFTDVGILAEAIGSRYHLRSDDVPILDRPLLAEPAGIDRLHPPDPGSQGRLPAYVEAVDRLFQTAGDMLPVFAYIPCPFTTAAGLRGVDDFLMDTILEPERARQLLEVSLEAAIRLSDECVLAGGLPVLVDPLASGSVLSRRTYSEFALPYERRLMDYLHRFDLDVTLHICGDTTTLVDLIPATGADLFSFDKLEVCAAMTAMGQQIRLVGNISPSLLLESSRVSLEPHCLHVIQQGLGNPRGFVFSTGCEAPIRCCAERLDMMIRIGKQSRYER